MRITSVKATPVNVPAEFEFSGASRATSLGICVVEISTDEGHVGVGMTAITEEEIVAYTINTVAGPAIKGEDPFLNERIWSKLYWLMTPRGQSGYACHAISAIDVALWDIKGQSLGVPVWKLLGGARSEVPCYATIGFDFFDNEQLADVAKEWKLKGYDKFKMVVGHNGIKRRDEPRPLMQVLKNDVHRVRTLRDAIGSSSEIFIDANCNLDGFHAGWLASHVADMEISFFEEPVVGNDPQVLRDLKQRTSIPLAGGQNEGQSAKFKDLLVNRSLDVVQPNVVISGGYTQCTKIAGMADAFGIGVDNGGAWPFHNMHLHAGVKNGGMVEYHILAVECLKKIFNDLPEPSGGYIKMSEKPGLGFDLNKDALEELARMPTSKGSGK